MQYQAFIQNDHFLFGPGQIEFFQWRSAFGLKGSNRRGIWSLGCVLTIKGRRAGSPHPFCRKPKGSCRKICTIWIHTSNCTTWNVCPCIKLSDVYGHMDYCMLSDYLMLSDVIEYYPILLIDWILSDYRILRYYWSIIKLIQISLHFLHFPNWFRTFVYSVCVGCILYTLGSRFYASNLPKIAHIRIKFFQFMFSYL